MPCAVVVLNLFKLAYFCSVVLNSPVLSNVLFHLNYIQLVKLLTLVFLRCLDEMSG